MQDAIWIEIKVKLGWELADAVANFLVELGSPGLQIEEVDERTVVKGYLRPGAQEKAQQLRRYLDNLGAMGLTDGHEELHITPLVQTNWLSAWRSRFHPFRVGRRFLITPSWQKVSPTGGQIVIVIDPQMAFGTGEHFTTQFCLRALEDLVQEGDCVLDVGTGSGILSIAAVKLGARRSLGLDIDPQAIATASENARFNDVSRQSKFLCSPLDQGVGTETFHGAVANITGQVLLPLLPQIRRVLLPGGYAILAGFLVEEQKNLCSALAQNGLCLCRTERQEEWLCAVAQRR